MGKQNRGEGANRKGSRGCALGGWGFLPLGGHAQSYEYHPSIVLGCCVENDFLLPLNGPQHPENLNSSHRSHQHLTWRDP